MDRRAFNKLLGSAGIVIAAGARAKETASANSQAGENESQRSKWPEGVYRRFNVDTHVPDWDPHLLANFDPAEYVRTIAQADFQSLLVWANSHTGLCLWKTKVGPQHANMKGRDYFGEVIQECQRHKLHTVAYYSLIEDLWAFDHYPDWRIVPENGIDRTREGRIGGRLGVVCPNSPYRERAVAQLRELVGSYEFDGIFLDMTFWTYVCYCAHCTERFRKEHDAELPRIVNWDDPIWRSFQKAREQWLLEFAMVITKTIKDVRPITVGHQYATVFANWKLGVPLELRDASDFASGDFYGGPTEYSLVCKAYHGLTRMRPFEFWTSRTTNLFDFETTKTSLELLTSASVATLHSAAYIMTDSIKADGTIDPEVYKFLRQQNEKLAPYEPFLGGDMLADVAIYCDKESMYDPAENGVHVAQAKDKAPHIDSVLGAARILRQAHIPYGVVTNVNLEELSNFRAVIVPNVLEMAADQAAQFREFVRKGGTLYASGPSSLNRFDPGGPRFLLEDVLGIRYKGMMGTAWSYLSPKDNEVKQWIWPQDAVSFPGHMIQAEPLAGAQVLATVTLPFIDPTLGNRISGRFAQIWNDPPALTPGTSPGIVINSFGQGKAIWLAAPIEAGDHPVNAKLVASLLRRVLLGPYQFEVDTHPSVEMTLFHQPDKRRLIVSLLNMEWQLAPIGRGATVRAQLPSGRSANAVLALPERKELKFRQAGRYVEFQIEPFESMAMASVVYA
jgi:hypothetical protein